MFAFYLDYLDKPALFISFFGAIVLALVLGIAFHEFCHAWSASALGDRTAANRGRLTLNPLAHLDPLGSFLLLIAGFGWGKPTPVNPYNLRNGPRTGMAVVAAAGPLSNLVVAAILALPIRLGIVPWREPFVSVLSTRGWSGEDYVGMFLATGILINLLLFAFNFLPIAPLDGFKIWLGVLPMELARPIARLEQYGIVILMGLIFLGPWVFGVNLIGEIIGPAVVEMAGWLTGA